MKYFNKRKKSIKSGGDKKRIMLLRLVLLCLVILTALLLRYQGICWPKLHHDEHKIARWLDWTAKHSYLDKKVYPGGFFTIARPARKAVEGTISVYEHWLYRLGRKDRLTPAKINALMFGRHLNVWLGTFTCLFLFLMVKRISGSYLAGLFGAALLCFAACHIDHCHYAESDVAMLLTLTIALWLWLWVSDKKHPLFYGLASIASGFAAGTKYTLVLLIILVVVYGLRQKRWQCKTRTWLQIAGCLLAGIFLFLLGFIWANPGILHFEWFIAGIKYEAARVYHETAGILGPAYGDKKALYINHWHRLIIYALSLGRGWLILSAVGLPFIFCRSYRRYWPAMLLFPLVFLYYFIFKSPWVRSQEFMVFLPFLSVAATLPLVSIWRLKRLRFPALRKALVLFAGCIALLGAAQGGIAVANLFGWTDTRFLADRWLRRHAPFQRTIGTESYASPDYRRSLKKETGIYKVEKAGLKHISEAGCDYVMRNLKYDGRGIHDPRTGKRFPIYQRHLEEFFANSELLSSWNLQQPKNVDSLCFCSPKLSLYGLKRFTGKTNIRVRFPRPLYLSESGRETFFSGNRNLGSDAGILVDRYWREIAVGDLGKSGKPLFIVLNTEERPTQVRIKGLGRRLKIDLDAYDMRVIPLKRPKWLPGTRGFEKITVSTTPVKHIRYIPCYLRVAFSREEAAGICTGLGFEEKAWKLLEENSAEPLVNAAGRYILAVNTGHWKVAGELESPAVEKMKLIKKCLGAKPSSFRINGISGFYYNEFSRIRLQRQNRPKVMKIAVCKGREKEKEPAESTGKILLHLPVRLAKGRYEINCELRAKSIDKAKSSPCGSFSFTNEKDELLTKGRWENFSPEKFTKFTFPFVVGRERKPQTYIRSSVPVNFSYRNLEVRWNTNTVLSSVYNKLVASLVRHRLHRGDYEGALEMLAQTEGSPWNKAELQRLGFQALLGFSRQRPERFRGAARQLLELAPSHYQCIKALAGENPSYATAAKSLEGNLQEAIVFKPYLALRGLSFDTQRKSLRCVFEALKDETPSLAVVILTRRHGRWRKKHSEPISARPFLSQGERVMVEIKLEGKIGQQLDFHRLGLAIQANVKYAPGRLKIASRNKKIITLDTILR